MQILKSRFSSIFCAHLRVDYKRCGVLVDAIHRDEFWSRLLNTIKEIHKMKSNGGVRFMTGPFFPLHEAAAYCGYESPDAFRRMVRELGFDLPRCGPKGNRYAKSVLDEWMNNPSGFQAVRTTRKTPNAVTL